MSSSISLDRGTLSEESLNILRTRGDDRPKRPGYRIISSTSFRSGDSADPELTVDIPDRIESIETLRFLELNAEGAADAWAMRQRLLDGGIEFPIDEIATRYVGSMLSKHDPWCDEDDWVGAMQQIGLTEDFQQRLMAEDFKEERSMRTLKEWVFEMMSIRFAILDRLDETIKASAMPPQISSQMPTQMAMERGQKHHTKSIKDFFKKPANLKAFFRSSTHKRPA